MYERALLADADRRAALYLDSLADRRAFPSEDARAGLAHLFGDFPMEGEEPADILHRLDVYGSPATTASAGGRYFGFVVGGALPIAAAADRLVLAWDQCASSAVNSPTAAALELAASQLVLEALDLPRQSAVGFGTSATACALSCLTAARRTLLQRAGWDFDRRGLYGAPPVRVIVPDTAHVTILKALRIMGVGIDWIVRAPCDDEGRVDPQRLPALNDQTLLCLQAGEVNTGGFDPFHAILPQARQAGAWVHVDGAFGLWARASSKLRPLTVGVEHADSWTTDGHKWLNVPYDAAMAICRHPGALAEAMNADAAYASADPDAQKNLTLEFSRRLRGAAIWASLRSLGRRGLEAMLETHVGQANRLAENLRRLGLHVLNAVSLNQVLFRADDDVTTQRLLQAVQSEGLVWFGPSRWQNRAACRVSVSSWRTTDADIDTAVEAIARAFSAARS